MQTATHSNLSFDPHSESLKLGSAEQSLLAPALLVAAVGGGIACLFGLRPGNMLIFAHTYLVAYLFYLSITLGAIFFVVLHHLARAGWSVTLRRIAEALAANIGLMALLSLPLLLGLSSIYPWAQPALPGQEPSAAALAGFLTVPAFVVRMVIYFAVWGFLAWYMRSRSIQQDASDISASANLALSKSMERLAAPGMFIFAFTITGLAVDLIMSMISNWGSTIIGVYFFANCVLGALVTITLLSMLLQASGRLRGALSLEHYHDLGKLTFGFVFFWGYIAFSQFMLIWYANLPEESQFFMPRQIGPWVGVSIVLIVFHLLIPFLGLISRNAKRCLPIFAFWLVWMLVADVLDFYWLIMPNTFIQKIAGEVGMPGKPLPEAFKKLLASHHSVYALSPAHAGFGAELWAPLQPGSLLLLAAVVLGMGGLYVASTTWFLKSASLVPVGDPRLQEALAFENV